MGSQMMRNHTNCRSNINSFSPKMDLVPSLHHQAFQILSFIADPISEGVCVCVWGGGGGGAWCA